MAVLEGKAGKVGLEVDFVVGRGNTGGKAGKSKLRHFESALKRIT